MRLASLIAGETGKKKVILKQKLKTRTILYLIRGAKPPQNQKNRSDSPESRRWSLPCFLRVSSMVSTASLRPAMPSRDVRLRSLCALDGAGLRDRRHLRGRLRKAGKDRAARGIPPRGGRGLGATPGRVASRRCRQLPANRESCTTTQTPLFLSCARKIVGF